MLDLIVRGGRVVTPWGVGNWDVGVQGEKIAAVAEPNTLPRDVARVVEEAARLAREEIEPITDVRSTAAYRRYVAGVLVQDGLRRAWARAGGGDIQ